MTNKSKTLDSLGENSEKVMRASKQDIPEPTTFMTSTINWVKKLEMDEPEWGKVRANYVDNRIRDEWLSMISRAEPHLSSVLSTAVTLDANRQFSLIGGRNQVKRYVNTFRNFDNGLGFRTLQTLSATNYYVSDIGSPVEIETDGRNGPLVSLYHTDPTRLRLGGDGTLKYDSAKKGVTIWRPDQYYRVVSQRSTQDKLNGIGYSAISRCVKIAQIMVAVVEHNLEKLQQIAPDGILFVQAEDLTQQSWNDAQEARQVKYEENTGNRYYDNVMVIVDRAAKGDLMALSELPERFDAMEFTDYALKAYALSFGRPVRAFWSLNSGNFGGGTETKIQAEQATYGGAAEFILSSQEQIQWLLPSSLIFEYEVEDTGGKLQQAELDDLLIKASGGLLDIGLTTVQAQQWLAERGVIPSEWTDSPIEVAENGLMKSRLLDTEQIQRALDDNPNEPIVKYQSPTAQHPSGRTIRLWDNKRDAIGKSWRVTRKIKKRATIEDFDENENEDEVGNFMFTAASEAYLAENEDRDETEEEAYLLALAMLNGGEPLDDDTVAELTALMALIVPASVLIALLALRDKSNGALPEAYLINPELWNGRLEYFRGLGMILANPEQLFMWVLGDTEHCDTCLGQEGIVKTGIQWFNDGILPQGSSLLCGGFRCQCQLVPV